MAVFNICVLMALVSLGGLNPVFANMCRLAVTTPLHFGIHRWFTWSKYQLGPIWKQWWRYLGMKVSMMAAKQLCFMALIIWFNMPYLLAYLLCLCIFGLTKFNLSRRFIFKDMPGSDDPPQ